MVVGLPHNRRGSGVREGFPQIYFLNGGPHGARVPPQAHRNSIPLIGGSTDCAGFGPGPTFIKTVVHCEERDRLASIYHAAVARNIEAASAMAQHFSEAWRDGWQEEMKDMRIALLFD